MQSVLRRSDKINLPARFFLNEKGSDYFICKRVPLKEMRGLDGERSMGFDRPVFPAPWLELLVVGGMLSCIELDRAEFVSVRSPLTSMTRSVLYGAVISRFRSQLKRVLVSSPAVSGILRNPSSMLLFSNQAAISAAIGKRSRQIQGLGMNLRSLCHREIASNRRFDDPEETIDLADRLIRAIGGESLLLLDLSLGEALDLAAQTVVAYAGKMGLADHLALLLVEFVQLAEKSYLRSMAERDLYVRSHPAETERLLADPEFRSRLRDLGSRRGDMMDLRIAFDTLPASYEDSGAFSIALRTKGSLGWEGAQDAASKKKAIHRTDLATLLKSAAQDDGYADSSLSYYAGFEHACSEEDMSFSSNVDIDQLKRETTATMRIVI